MRTERPLAPASAVYDEASALYRRAFGLLVVLTAIVAVCFNGIVFVRPEFVIFHLSWGLLVNFTGVAMLASALLVPVIVSMRATAGKSYGSPLAGLREHGWHIALATLVLILANGILIFSIFGIVLAALLTVRLAFIAVAASLEDQDVTDSLARSWELTDRVTKRTGLVLFGAAAPMIALLLFLAIVDLSPLATTIAMVVGETLVVPHLVAVLVVLFEEYRALKPEPEDFGPRHRSPPF